MELVFLERRRRLAGRADRLPAAACQEARAGRQRGVEHRTGDFYAAQGVQEILVAHPQEHWVRCYDLQAAGVEVPRSRVLDVAMDDVVAAIDWPS